MESLSLEESSKRIFQYESELFHLIATFAAGRHVFQSAFVVPLQEDARLQPKPLLLPPLPANAGVGLPPGASLGAGDATDMVWLVAFLRNSTA